MILTKTKKRKIRKAVKKKNLKLIDKDYIKANQTWIPETLGEKFYIKSDSWFDIKVTHKKSHIPPHISDVQTSSIRTNIITLQPSVSQRHILKQWMEAYRRIYNLVITNKKDFIHYGKMESYFSIRYKIFKYYLPYDKELVKLIEKYKVDKHVLNNAVNDVTKAFKAAKANQTAGNIKSFRLRHKKKSHHLRTLVIEPTQFSSVKNGFCTSVFGEIKSSKPLINIKREVRLAYNSRTGKFILRIPYDKVIDECYLRNNVANIDQGKCKTESVYSSDGICYSFGTAGSNSRDTKFNKVQKLLMKVNNVKKNLTKKDGKKKNYIKFLRRLREKITNMIADKQNKTVRFLCETFDIINVGNMSTTGICKKGSFLTNFDKQYIIAMSHYQFRQKLKNKGDELGVKVKVINEAYSSKTCGKCGELNKKLGGSRTFKCPQLNCNFIMDRDYNGGRNIEFIWKTTQ